MCDVKTATDLIVVTTLEISSDMKPIAVLTDIKLQ